MQRGRSRLLILGVLFAALTACSMKPALKPTPKPTANPETSYKRITLPGAPHYTLQHGQSAMLPKPEAGHFAPPVYPVSLAHPGMPLVVVKAQLVFGKDGKVHDVVILSDSYKKAGHKLFEDAVRTAAIHWAFTPLVISEYVDDANTVTFKRTPKPFSLWFAFRFAMVNGKPNTSVARH